MNARRGFITVIRYPSHLAETRIQKYKVAGRKSAFFKILIKNKEYTFQSKPWIESKCRRKSRGLGKAGMAAQDAGRRGYHYPLPNLPQAGEVVAQA